MSTERQRRDGRTQSRPTLIEEQQPIAFVEELARVGIGLRRAALETRAALKIEQIGRIAGLVLGGRIYGDDVLMRRTGKEAKTTRCGRGVITRDLEEMLGNLQGASLCVSPARLGFGARYNHLEQYGCAVLEPGLRGRGSSPSHRAPPEGKK